MDIKLIIAGVLLITAFASGWGLRNRDFKEYKVEVENAAKAQEAHVESIKKQQALVNKGVEDEYNAKLALLRQYYANGVRQPNTSKLPNISNASNGVNDLTTNTLLACAETTQQLISLQDWINQQIGIK